VASQQPCLPTALVQATSSWVRRSSCTVHMCAAHVALHGAHLCCIVMLCGGQITYRAPSTSPATSSAAMAITPAVKPLAQSPVGSQLLYLVVFNDGCYAVLLQMF
jgi:hypothetical protein